MPRARLLPYGNYKRLYAISDEGLNAVQKQFGCELNAETRGLIRLATVAFSFRVQIEAYAPPKATVTKIKKFQDLTRSLQKSFPYYRHQQFRRSKEMSDFISRREDNWKFVAPAFWLQWFAELLQENADITHIVLQYLSQQSGISQRGNAWDWWVFSLNRICKEAQLPAEVRKDGLGVSPFVALIDEIQQQLPKQLKDFVKKRSEEGLAKAISRAIEELTSLRAIPVKLLIEYSLGLTNLVVEDGQILVSSYPDNVERIDKLLLQADQPT